MHTCLRTKTVSFSRAHSIRLYSAYAHLLANKNWQKRQSLSRTKEVQKSLNLLRRVFERLNSHREDFEHSKSAILILLKEIKQNVLRICFWYLEPVWNHTVVQNIFLNQYVQIGHVHELSNVGAGGSRTGQVYTCTNPSIYFGTSQTNDQLWKRKNCCGKKLNSWRIKKAMARISA